MTDRDRTFLGLGILIGAIIVAGLALLLMGAMTHA